MKYLDLTIPDHSYFFGFVQADGTLGRLKSPYNKGRLQIELGKKDLHILRSFSEMFPLVSSSINCRERDTNFKKGYATYTFSVFDKNFREEINKLGVPYGRKSEIVSLPKGKFCERDYFRGLVDGDGSVGTTRKGLPFLSFSVKSKELKDYFCDVIERIIGERKRLSRNRRDATYNIMLNRERAQKFIKFLYYPGCLTLKRKLKMAERSLEWKRPKNLKRIFKKFWEPWEDEYILTHSIEENCHYLKRTERSIKMRFWRLKNYKAPYLKACLDETKIISTKLR